MRRRRPSGRLPLADALVSRPVTATVHAMEEAVGLLLDASALLTLLSDDSAAAQALFSASGLDEQAKRFLAREGLFKDFTLRITSAYSEVSGQVVPKAEVESKAAVPWLGIKDLRLRYQAPIAGSNQGKGQRAQAEARFSEKFSGQIQVDNESPETPLDLGADLRFRWEWND